MLLLLLFQIPLHPGLLDQRGRVGHAAKDGSPGHPGAVSLRPRSEVAQGDQRLVPAEDGQDRGQRNGRSAQEAEGPRAAVEKIPSLTFY